MKSTATKSTPSKSKASTTSFFDSQKSEGAFFGDNETATTDFFPVQAKLTIGAPNDRYEQEADAVADRVVKGLGSSEPTKMTGSPPAIQHKCASCEAKEKGEIPKTVQRKPVFESDADGGEVQRTCSSCGKEEKVQKKPDGSSVASPAIQNQLNNSKGGGSSLPEDTRTSMESSIGADFSHVKVHTDSNAIQMNKDLGAQAFTHGSDVYFNAGKYDTNSKSGNHLLAHELVHTVQQNASQNTVQKKCDSCEAEESMLQKKEDCGSESEGATVPEKCGEEPPIENHCPEAEPENEQPPEDTAEPDDEPMTIKGLTEDAMACQTVEKPSVTGKTPECKVPEPEEKPKEEKQLSPCDMLELQQQNLNAPADDKKEKKEKKKKSNSSILQNNQPLELNETLGLGEEASPDFKIVRDENNARASAAKNSLISKLSIVNDLASQKIKFKTQQSNDEAAANKIKSFIQSKTGRISQIINNSINLSDSIAQDIQAKKEKILGKGNKLQEETLIRYEINKQKVNTQSSIAIQQVKGAYNKTVSDINNKAKIARNQLMLKLKQSDLALNDGRKTQLEKTEKDYNKGYIDIKNVGIYYGCQAKIKSEKKAEAYMKAEDSNSAYVKRLVTTPERDSWYEGKYTYNRYKARANAAREVGTQFKKSMKKEGLAAADKFMCGKQGDLEMVNETANEGLKNSYCTFELGITAVEAQQQENLKQAKELMQKSVSDIRKKKKTTLEQLDFKQKVQTPFIKDYSIRLAMNIEQNGQQAIASILSGVDSVVTTLYEQLESFIQQTKERQTPEIPALEKEIKERDLAFSKAEGITSIIANQANSEVTKDLGNHASYALTDLDFLNTKDEGEATEITETTIDAIRQVRQQAQKGYKIMLKNYHKSIDTFVSDFSGMLDAIVTGITGMFKTMNLQLQKSIESQMNGLVLSMKKQNEQALIPKIECEAEKAADEVEPAWKSVLKIIIVIVVVLVVAIVTAGALAALAGVVGLTAAAGASTAALIATKLVIVAVAGAMSSLAGTATSNLQNGRPVWEGFTVKGLVFDTILSVASLGFNKIAGAIIKGTSRISKVARVTFEALADIGASAGADAAQGREFSFEEALKGALIGEFVGGAIGKIRGKKKSNTDGTDSKNNVATEGNEGKKKADSNGDRKPVVNDTPTPKQEHSTDTNASSNKKQDLSDTDTNTTKKQDLDSPDAKKRKEENLENSKKKETDELTREELETETHEAAKKKPKEIDPESTYGKDYDLEINENGHTYRRNKKTKKWCRFSQVQNPEECYIRMLDDEWGAEDNYVGADPEMQKAMSKENLKTPEQEAAARQAKKDMRTSGDPRFAPRAEDRGKKVFDLFEQLKQKRIQFMGSTPQKFSGTGKKVIRKMTDEGKIFMNGMVVKDTEIDAILADKSKRKQLQVHTEIETGEMALVPIEDCDMGHIKAAVIWWTVDGNYKKGALSKEAKAFMKDDTNYELEHKGVNRRKGQELGQKYEYVEPPTI